MPTHPALQRAEAFCAAYSLQLPVLMAPMAGACPASLAVAVAQAGGLGGCGALLMKPDAIRTWVADVRAATNGGFQLNLWIPDPPPVRDPDHEAEVRAFLAQWGPSVPPEAGDATPVDFASQCDAILEAGGLTARASACDLLLARPTDPCSCRVTLPVCYRAITQLGDTTTNYHLQPGDRIFVARQSICEEMFSCCRGAKTCERCCARQVACRDPGFASQSPPEFVPPSFEMITPDPPELIPRQPDVVSEIGEGSVQANSSSTTPLINPVDEVLPGLLDGELDFSE